jgi:exodeoxyribonuclease VII small subunit
MSSTADDPEAIGYADALAELDEILIELEAEELDVDVLATRVARAAELVRLCRSRIQHARVEVERIVADLEAIADDGGPDDGDHS